MFRVTTLLTDDNSAPNKTKNEVWENLITEMLNPLYSRSLLLSTNLLGHRRIFSGKPHS